jgi:hypothetical protein
MSGAANRPALLVLVRHGQSQRNIVKKQNRFYLDDESRKSVKGVPDHLIELTDEGHRQAAQTGGALRDAYGAFEYVVHSGYKRTIQTTEEILKAYGPDERARMYVRHHLFVRERDAGQHRALVSGRGARAIVKVEGPAIPDPVPHRRFYVLSAASIEFARKSARHAIRRSERYNELDEGGPPSHQLWRSRARPRRRAAIRAL